MTIPSYPNLTLYSNYLPLLFKEAFGHGPMTLLNHVLSTGSPAHDFKSNLESGALTAHLSAAIPILLVGAYFISLTSAAALALTTLAVTQLATRSMFSKVYIPSVRLIGDEADLTTTDCLAFNNLSQGEFNRIFATIEHNPDLGKRFKHIKLDTCSLTHLPENFFAVFSNIRSLWIKDTNLAKLPQNPPLAEIKTLVRVAQTFTPSSRTALTLSDATKVTPLHYFTTVPGQENPVRVDKICIDNSTGDWKYYLDPIFRPETPE